MGQELERISHGTDSLVVNNNITVEHQYSVRSNLVYDNHPGQPQEMALTASGRLKSVHLLYICSAPNNQKSTNRTDNHRFFHVTSRVMLLTSDQLARLVR